jgi:hypothetical protein
MTMTKVMLIGLALGTVLILGCGDNGTHEQSDSGTQPQQHDAAPPEDAGNGQDAPAGCGFAAVYSTFDFVSTDIGTNSTEDPSNYLFFDGFLNQAANPDLLEIELVSGYGVFVDGLKAGTFKLTGDELDYGTCGLCVRLLSKVDPASWEANQYYMATGGTVTLSSVMGQLAGTLSNVTFTHVDIDQSTLVSTPLDDGCNSRASSVSFEAEMAAPDGGWEDTDGGAAMPDGMQM